MKKITFLVSALFLSLITLAQIAPDKYYIQFTDKDNSPYSISSPEEFLTQRALDRRSKFNIEITTQDLPVNPLYLDGVEEVGVDLLNPSKWLNGVTIYTTNSSLITTIGNLPYVESVTKMHDRSNVIKSKSFEEEKGSDEFKPSTLKSSQSSNSMNYGDGTTQIEQINGVLLHDEGFKGEGMVIAVLDAGFDNVDIHPLFDSVWANNQILGDKDFVVPGGDVYNAHYHGRAVLSTMAANSPGELIGTAPKASYWLLRSEEGSAENVIEEYNWVSAAEYADSVGADVINSSLGYVDFDMPQWDHVYDDMNGVTCIGTIGADIAANKGILVVNSAGNSGTSSFPWMGAPGDGFDVFTIGAVNGEGSRASFSSTGPTADGRTKPEIMAMGSGTAFADGDDGVTFGNGTSFSSPIIAGMCACLMQAYPNKTPLEIRESLKLSSDNVQFPNNTYGWGIPDYMKAYSTLTTIEIGEGNDSEMAFVYPNPFNEDFTIRFNSDLSENINVSMIDITGRVIFNEKISVSESNNRLNFTSQLQDLEAGVYFLQMSTESRQEIKRIIKN